MVDPVPILVALVMVACLVFALLMLIKLVLAFGAQRWTGWCLTPGGLINRFLQYQDTALAAAVVRQMAAITALNIPVTEGLRMAAAGERGRLRRVLQRISVYSSQGFSLSHAVKEGFPGCPRLVVSSMAASERAGQMSRGLADLRVAMDDLLRTQSRNLDYGSRYWIIPVATLINTVVVLMGLMVFVVPRLREVFRDYDITTPPVTLLLYQAAGDLLPASIAALLILLCAAIALWLAGWALRRDDEHSVEVMFDTLGWIPFFSRPFSEARGMAVIIRFLRSCLVAGLSPAVAIRLAADIRVNHFLRRRWLLAADGVSGGAPLSQSSQAAQLGPLFVNACRNLERPGGDICRVLDHAAEVYQALAERWTQSVARLLWPLVTLVLGCLVAFVAFGFFVPLVVLIESCMGGLS